jgi:hypothetical protein
MTDTEIVSALSYEETVSIIRRILEDQPFSTTGTTRGLLLSSQNADVSQIQGAVDSAVQKKNLRGNLPNVDQGGLFSKSPAEIDAWLDANVNNLQDAKAVLKKLVKVVLLVLQERGAA